MKNTSLNISIENVTKKYDEFYALKDISLNITSGEFMTLLGPSGSGKTTLLMVLAGFTNPDHGSVKFGDEEVILKPPHLRGINELHGEKPHGGRFSICIQNALRSSYSNDAALTAIGS